MDIENLDFSTIGKFIINISKNTFNIFIFFGDFFPVTLPEIG